MADSDKSALISGMDVATPFIAKLKEKGVTDEDFRLLATPEGAHLIDQFVDQIAEVGYYPKPIITNYKVPFNPNMSLADMIVAGKYDWVHPDITQEHFPLSEHVVGLYRQAPVELRLVYFGRGMTTQQVLVEFDKQGLRPATLPELCSLGASHSEFPMNLRPIVALGSEWRREDGDPGLPFLQEMDGERQLGLDWHDLRSSWPFLYHFLAVSK